MQDGTSGRYGVSIDDLERSAHIPVDQQVAVRAGPPPPGPISAEELDRQLLLGVTGAGRLRQP